MKKFTIFIIVIVLVVWAAGFLTGNSSKMAGQNSKIKGDVVKVGVIAPMSGDAAVYGESARNVYQIAVDEINARGGIEGKQIQLIIEDGKCNGEGGANAAQKLVNVDKVQVIIGGFCSAESLSAVPVAEAKKVALISPASSNPSLTGKSRYFFRNFPSDSSQGSVLAQVAYDSGKRKIAFIEEQTDYTAGISKAFEEKFKTLGGEVMIEQYQPTTKDFRTELVKLRATKPDVLFINANTPANMEAITQQFKAMNWKVSLFTNDIVLGATEVLSKYKITLEGMIGAEFGVDPANTKFQKLADSYMTKYGKELPYQSYAQTEYDAVYIVKDAIEAVGYDGAKIAEFGHNISGWQGASGSVTIGSNGDIVGGHRAVVVKSGKIEMFIK